MVVFPPCKINLGLRVLRKRADGYHDIDTCFYPVQWTDILEIIPADSFLFQTTGLSIEGPADRNLCIKAYHLMAERFQLPPVSMHLHKVIPMGAGLGGGSADGAYTLKVLNEIFDLKQSDQQLREFAAVLGSDCAFFIDPQPMIGSGRGEVMEPVALSLKNKFIVIVKPDVHVSTAEAYAGVVPDEVQLPVRDVVLGTLDYWPELLVNDFERSVIALHPVIGQLKQAMYDNGAIYAAMSGSGSAVFGLFDHEPNLSGTFTGLPCWTGLLHH